MDKQLLNRLILNNKTCYKNDSAVDFYLSSTSICCQVLNSNLCEAIKMVFVFQARLVCG
jgi:hypothetical protein